MARIGFVVAMLSSLILAGWFAIAEIESPGMSHAVALMITSCITSFFGLQKLDREVIQQGGKAAAWFAFGLSILALGYITMFFSSWLLAAIGWVLLQIPMLVGIFLVPSVKNAPEEPPVSGP